MKWNWSRRAARVAVKLLARPDALLAAACAVALAGCNQTGAHSMGQRGATVAFESIDGPPPGQFQTLVQNLNTEAQARQLAVISREQPSVYRVRGYLAAHVVKGRTTISWVWDVFDKDERRALRITGEETAKGRPRDAWTAADNAMLARIARDSMDQLAGFLNAPAAVPGAPAPAPEPAAAPNGPLVSANDTSPEAAGIFRIPQATPVPAGRPEPAATVSPRETLSLSASRH
jgi:hypothetical protein